MRADARRNRELIVMAALDLFTERGASVSMEEVARAAGVAVGTLYRHFPDRRTLLEDIAAGGMRRLLTFSQSAAARDVPRWEVLRQIVEHCVGLPLALIKSLSDVRPAHSGLPELEHELNALLEVIVEQAQDEGPLRGDIPAREIVGLFKVMVCRPGARADDHLTTVMLDGLSPSWPGRRDRD